MAFSVAATYIPLLFPPRAAQEIKEKDEEIQSIPPSSKNMITPTTSLPSSSETVTGDGIKSATSDAFPESLNNLEREEEMLGGGVWGSLGTSSTR